MGHYVDPVSFIDVTYAWQCPLHTIHINVVKAIKYSGALSLVKKSES